MPMTRILIVDDEVGVTRLLRRSLLEAGTYDVRVEHSAAAALVALREFVPDLILLDVVMPGMSGRELAAVLGRDAALAAPPILFLTALPVQPVEGLSTLDGHPCIEKPLRAEAVIEAIQSTLAAHKSGRSAL